MTETPVTVRYRLSKRNS